MYDLSWSADSQFIMSGSVDFTAILWEVKKGIYTYFTWILTHTPVFSSEKFIVYTKRKKIKILVNTSNNAVIHKITNVIRKTVIPQW